MNLARSIALTLVLSIVVAALGAWGGAQYVARQMRHAPALDELVHEKLKLTPAQQHRIAGLARQHAARREALQAEMRAANRDLARAIQAQHAYTPEVQAAVDRLHRAMGELQKETILHVLAMRSVLTPHQAAQFDSTVSQSLTDKVR
jgi:Spy/CpxP family protein refolding chaperone